MAVAEYAGDRPGVTLVMPDDHEIGDAFAVAALELAEAVRPQFDGAEILDRIHPHAGGYELAAEMSADILARVGDHCIARPRHASGVVTKLDIGREIAGVLVELSRCVAMIERVEHRRVERGDGSRTASAERASGDSASAVNAAEGANTARVSTAIIETIRLFICISVSQTRSSTVGLLWQADDVVLICAPAMLG